MKKILMKSSLLFSWLLAWILSQFVFNNMLLFYSLLIVSLLSSLIITIFPHKFYKNSYSEDLLAIEIVNLSGEASFLQKINFFLFRLLISPFQIVVLILSVILFFIFKII